MNQLATACGAYRNEYGEIPDTNNVHLVRLLTGANRSNIVFMEFPQRDLNAKKEVIDPWKIPYRFAVKSDGKFQIGSAGPDRMFDTSDDLVIPDSLSVTNRFSRPLP
jgi:hypothetical protein